MCKSHALGTPDSRPEYRYSNFGPGQTARGSPSKGNVMNWSSGRASSRALFRPWRGVTGTKKGTIASSATTIRRAMASHLRSFFIGMLPFLPTEAILNLKLMWIVICN